MRVLQDLYLLHVLLFERELRIAFVHSLVLPQHPSLPHQLHVLPFYVPLRLRHVPLEHVVENVLMGLVEDVGQRLPLRVEFLLCLLFLLSLPFGSATLVVQILVWDPCQQLLGVKLVLLGPLHAGGQVTKALDLLLGVLLKLLEDRKKLLLVLVGVA